MKSSRLVAIFLVAANSASIAQNADDSTRPSISANEFVEKAGSMSCPWLAAWSAAVHPGKE